jgi:hypothetical protein
MNITCVSLLASVSAAYACHRRKQGFLNVKYLGDGGIIGYSLIVPEGLVKPDGTHLAIVRLPAVPNLMT